MAGNILVGSVPVEHLFIFILILIVTIFLAILIYALIRRFLDNRISENQSKIIAIVFQYSVITIGLYYGVYHILKLDITALAASFGIVGIAVTFASQDVIQNLIAGILIITQRPIRIGDWIEIGGSPETEVSKVKEIKLTSTTLRNANGRIIYLPNSFILSSRIINYTKSGILEIPLQLAIPYKSDYSKIKSIIIEIAYENKRILPVNLSQKEEIATYSLSNLSNIMGLVEDKTDLNRFPPRILFSNISGGSVILDIRLWIKEIETKDEIVNEFLEALIERLKEENIEL
ncbi:mechanosensitive ion channel family protein [Methanococcoides sp. FTZ1]|uniref:mechanosensitive ion channel family protein n=1 Tax=Methanococcoides sp. FTZ1 TaxID=3439061 RepID=UPI003F87654C